MTSRAHGWLCGLAALALTASFACGRDNNQQATTASNTAANTTAATHPNTPDWWTTTKIQAKFFADKTVKGRDIDVSTKDGVVTLTGSVDSTEAKTRAEALAREVDGVTTVNDNLAVQSNTTAANEAANGAVATSGHEAANAVQPAWITTKIQAQYYANPGLKPWNIDVTTMSNGTVTLNGSVDSAESRTKAEDIARKTDGVTNVNNQLRVTSGSAGAATTAERPINEPDAWLTAKVQSKYYANDLVKGRDIDVDTHDGVVTLTGTVGSSAERDEADALARSTDGVRDVRDNLTVAVTPASAHLNPVHPIPEPNHVSKDDWITTRIRSRFFIDSNVKNMNVDVSTQDGVVTLTGQVQDQNAKAAAEAIASRTDGVKKVNNQLTIKQ